MKEQWHPSFPYYIYNTHKYFYLSCKLQHLQDTQYLRINKSTTKIETIDKSFMISHLKSINPAGCMLIIGTLIIKHQIYLLVVDKAKIVFENRQDSIYSIESVKHYAFRNWLEYDSSINKKNNEDILKYIEQQLLKSNFYFRYKTDITLSMEKYHLDQRNTDPKFFWNKNMVKIFKQSNAHKCWRLPIMQGFIKTKKIYNSFYYLLINRRSKAFSGPKFLCRGINPDDDFNVANYNETEQIFKVQNNWFSFVTIRGSVPVYWSQRKGTLQINLQKSKKDEFGFNNHFKGLEKQFNDKKIYLLSWLNKSQSQSKLKQSDQSFQNCFYHSKQNFKENSKYEYYPITFYDDQKDVLQNLRNKITKSSQLLMPFYDNFFWAVQDQKSSNKMNIKSKQKIVYRINCLDCTNRSSAIGSLLSSHYLSSVQGSLKLFNPKSNFLIQKDFESDVIKIWDELTNKISYQYCGYQSQVLGKKPQYSFFSMFSGPKDYATDSDISKDKRIGDLLCQVEPKQIPWVQRNIETRLNFTQHCEISILNFFVLTWNCNACNPFQISQLNKEKLFHFNRGKIDIVVINLQQMVQLSTSNVLKQSNFEIISDWKKVIEEGLNQKIKDEKEKYELVIEKNLVAITTWVYIKNRTKQKHFQQKESIVIKTGFSNTLGNKGATVIFLKFESTWITIINCHLAAGQGKKTQRLESLKHILYYGLAEQKNMQLMAKSDYVFLIGDLNFRLQEQEKQDKEITHKVYELGKLLEVYKLKAETQLNSTKDYSAEIRQKFEWLWAKDQLIDFKNKEVYFLQRFYQLPLLFMPTYKFVKKSQNNQYDTKRSPAWCDRILFQSKIKQNLQMLMYKDISSICASDHKPVFGIFTAKIKKIIDRQKYNEELSKLKKQYFNTTDSNKFKTKQYKQVIPSKKNLSSDEQDAKSQFEEALQRQSKLNYQQQNSTKKISSQNFDFFPQQQQQQNRKADANIDLLSIEDASQGNSPTKKHQSSLIDLENKPSAPVQSMDNSPSKGSNQDFSQFQEIVNKQIEGKRKKDNNLLDL